MYIPSCPHKPTILSSCGHFALIATSGMYRQALWMKHFGHLCLKRTLLWSTSPVIRYLNLGPIRKGQHRSMVQTAIKYKDRSGKTRSKGAGATLKNTQFLVCNWWCHVSSSLVYSVQSLHITFRYSWYIESSKGISSEICRQDPGDERWVYQGHARAPGGASSNPLLYLICICHVPCQTMSQIATINLL